MPPFDTQEARSRARLNTAMMRRNDTRRQVMRTPAPLASPGKLPPAAASRMQLLQGGGDDWGVGGLLEGPGNFVRDTIGPTGMNVIKRAGPAGPLQAPYQLGSMIPKVGPAMQEAYGDLVTDPYSYVGAGGGSGALKAVKGLSFVERILSRVPKSSSAATLDRGPAPSLVQSMLMGAGSPAGPANRLPGSIRDTPQARDLLEQVASDEWPGVKGGMDDPWTWGMNEEGDDAANILAGEEIPRMKGSISQEDEDYLLQALAHGEDFPDEKEWAIREAQQPGGMGIGTPQMGGEAPNQDRLARMLMEELGGRKPGRMTNDDDNLQFEFSMQQQGAPLAALAALGGYGRQRQQQQRRPPQMNPALQQRLRRRMPFMYR